MENEKTIPEQEKGMEETSQSNQTKQWIQDNLRIIVSVLIVIVIATGVYSYSKRTTAPEKDNTIKVSSSTSQEEATSDNQAIDNRSTEEAAIEDQEMNQEQAAPETVTDTQKQEDSVSSQPSSQETENSFVETAGKGDGVTHLARRALANYLEKNPDSSLTPEHKIYIEDYLRKAVNYKQGVRVGTSIEFSNQMIQDAMGKAKQLNDNQLKNLHKYAQRVPSLS